MEIKAAATSAVRVEEVKPRAREEQKPVERKEPEVREAAKEEDKGAGRVDLRA